MYVFKFYERSVIQIEEIAFLNYTEKVFNVKSLTPPPPICTK